MRRRRAHSEQPARQRVLRSLRSIPVMAAPIPARFSPSGFYEKDVVLSGRI